MLIEIRYHMMLKYDLERESLNRPSYREINNRLLEAKVALQNRKVFFASSDKVTDELLRLNIQETSEIWTLLLQLFDEIVVDDYVGGNPPEQSYETKIKNLELWAFAWSSVLLRKEMYVKFAIKNGTFYYVSLHKSKFPQNKERKK